MINILLIGSTGYVGKALIPFLSKDFQVIAPTRKELDGSNYSETFHNLKELNPDVIINVAGQSDPDKCEKNNNLSFLSNVILPSNLAKVSSKLNCKLIHLSSCSASENVGEYSRQKRLAEKLINEFTSNSTIIRCDKIYGHNDKFTSFVLDKLKSKEVFSLNDRNWREPVWIRDILNCIKREILINRKDNTTISVRPLLAYTKYQWGTLIADIYKYPINLMNKDNKFEKNRLKEWKFNIYEKIDFGTDLYIGIEEAKKAIGTESEEIS